MIPGGASSEGWGAYIAKLVGEVEDLADHGAKGTRQALLQHLRHRFGQDIEADHLLIALDRAQPYASERFS